MFSKSFADGLGSVIFAGSGFEDTTVNRFVPDEFRGNGIVLVTTTDLGLLVSNSAMLVVWELERLEGGGVVMGETFAVDFAGATAAFVISSNWDIGSFVDGTGLENRNGTGPTHGK